MTSRPWSIVERIFHEVLESPEPLRAARLKQACGDDTELQREVQSLLDQASHPGFLDMPAIQVAAATVSPSSGAWLVGQRIGSYTVHSLLGQGGMGEVYRAHDTRLNRDVAIKVLPRAFTGDPDRLARFEREAKALAALDHEHIGGILHEIEERDGVRALVLELVDGDTLADRIARGPVPINEALAWARQIADALDAAHEKGIIHRDLKPSNVKITPAGVVKVLDFGLARAGATEGGLDRLKDSPTITVEGVLVGTAAYMSPEQARGQVADKRSDVWAFGCVVYEMLTGRAVFAAPTVSDTLAAILHNEPDWDALPRELPQGTVTLLRRCLEKNLKRRRRDIGDLRGDLDDVIAPPQPAGARRQVVRERRGVQGALPWVLTAAASAAAVVGFRPEWQNPLADAHFDYLTSLPGIETEGVIHPDGRSAIYLSNETGKFHVWQIQIDSRETKDLTPESDNVRFSLVGNRSLGFTENGRNNFWIMGGEAPLQIRSLSDGTPQTPFLDKRTINIAWSPGRDRLVYNLFERGDPLFVADRFGVTPRRIPIRGSDTHNHGPVLSGDGFAYFVRVRPETGETDVWRVPADESGTEEPVIRGLDIGWLTWLDPAHTRTLVYIGRDEDGSGPSLWALDTNSKISRRVLPGPLPYTSISASHDGSRLVATAATPLVSLWSVPILADRAAEPRDVLAYGPSRLRAQAQAPRLSRTALFYLSPPGTRLGVWKLENGRISEFWNGSQGALLSAPAVSPNGDVALVVKKGSRWGVTVRFANGETHDLAGSLDVRGTPAWSPDGNWLAVGGSDATGNGLFMVPVAGGEPTRLHEGSAIDPTWSPKGDLILFAGQPEKGTAPLHAVRRNGQEVELPGKAFMTPRLARPRFLPDGSGVVFVATNPRVQQAHRALELWLFDINTGDLRQLTRLAADTGNGEIQAFDITPDGKAIVFDRLEEHSDIVLITRTR